jgi:hypothetical protein
MCVGTPWLLVLRCELRWIEEDKEADAMRTDRGLCQRSIICRGLP